MHRMDKGGCARKFPTFFDLLGTQIAPFGGFKKALIIIIYIYIFVIENLYSTNPQKLITKKMIFKYVRKRQRKAEEFMSPANRQPIRVGWAEKNKISLLEHGS